LTADDLIGLRANRGSPVDGYVTLGEPKQAGEWALGSIGQAVAWLRDQALAHYPDSEFARKHAGFGI
jgi:hypothetical protein